MDSLFTSLFAEVKSFMLSGIKRAVCLGTMSLMACALCTTGQIATFSGPAPWITQRNDSMIVRAQLDTSKLGTTKKITFVVAKFENNKKTVLKTKTFKVKEPAQDYMVGFAHSGLIGGNDFLQIEWTIPGTTEKGVIAPFGIVNFSAMAQNEPAHAQKVHGELSSGTLATILNHAQFIIMQNRQFCMLWSDNAIIVVAGKSASKDIIWFAFDGKNGKNAFLSYPDKIVDYVASNDSLHAFVYKRACADSIVYTKANWRNDITKTIDSNYTVITIPFPDLGLLPFDGRMLGFSAFVVSPANDKVIASYPPKASNVIPGTWGTVILDK